MVLDFENNLLFIQNNKLELKLRQGGDIINIKEIENNGVRIYECDEARDYRGNKFAIGQDTSIPKYNYRIEYEIEESNPLIQGKYNRDNIIQLLKDKGINGENIINKLANIMWENKVIFDDEITFAKDYEHKLEITDESPLKVKQYPIPYHYKQQVNEAIESMVQQRIIERSNSHFINPLVVVIKSDQSIRLCLDARELNKRMKNAYEMPRNIDSLLSSIGKKKFLTKIDLRSAFWLIKLEEQSKKYCAFSIDGNIFQFNVCPFGVKSSPSALIRFLHRILNKYEKFCIHYFDDILISSNTLDEHLQHIECIFKTLKENGLKINLEKCTFLQKEVKYLGHIIGHDGTKLSSDRLEEIKNYPRPRRIRSLRAWLGLLNYYKRYIKNYAKQTLPLLKLLKKGQKWTWNEEQELSFTQLKTSFLEGLTLQHPDFNLPFILRTDASHSAIAAELIQIQEGQEVPIHFISRILKNSEIKYAISEKEFLSIIYAVNKLRFYLIGKKFTIETDHIALTSIHNQKFSNNRMHRWSLLLQEYDFDIIYKPGKNMIAADILSRKYDYKQKQDVLINNIVLRKHGLFSTKRIREEQAKEEFTTLKEVLQVKEEKNMFLEDGIIKKKIGTRTVFVTTAEHTGQIIYEIHNQFNHPGSRKLWLIFREAYYCKNDEKIIKHFTNTCHTCQLSKEKNYTNFNLPQSIIVENKLDIIAIDYLATLPTSSKGYKNILVMHDIFTKYTKLIPTAKTDTETTLCAIEQFCYEFGKPKIILSDNATYFTNERFRNYLFNMGIKTYYTSIRHPQSNNSERQIKEVIKQLRIMLEENHHLWAKHLSTIELVMNHTPHVTTLISPVEMMTEHEPMRPWKKKEVEKYEELAQEARERMKKQARRWEEKQQKKIRKRVQFKEGDLVIIKSLKITNKTRKKVAKLTKPYHGPFEVKARISKNTYELIHPETREIKGRYHLSSIYTYTPT